MRRFAVAALILACAVTDARALAEQSPGRVAREVHARGRYPSDLSILPPEPPLGEGEATESGGDEPRRARGPVRLYRSGGSDDAPAAPPPDIRLPSFGPLGTILGWILVGVCVLAVVAVFVYALAQLRFKRPSPDDAPEAEKPRADELAQDPLLVMPELSAEELARSGRYREAIHALLVSGLFATGFRPEGRARGSTAREVVAALGDADRRKPSLHALLSATELVWFGGRHATAETYERARALYADVERGAPR